MGNQNVQHRLLWYTSGLDVLELPAHVETSSDADECPLGDWLLLTLSQCNGRGQTLESDRQNGRKTYGIIGLGLQLAGAAHVVRLLGLRLQSVRVLDDALPA